MKRTFDIDLRVCVAPLRRKAHRTRGHHRPGRHRQEARRAPPPPRPARGSLSLTDRPRDTSRLGAPASRASKTAPDSDFGWLDAELAALRDLERVGQWLARDGETATATKFVFGANDLWWEELEVDKTTLAITVTGEH